MTHGAGHRVRAVSQPDPFDTETEVAARAEKARIDKLIRAEQVADFKWLMGQRRGRRIVWRLLERAGVFRTSFNPEALAMAFAEGRKNSGLEILADIHALVPELYPVMVKEANEHRITGDGRPR
jgi:hypothetical protein